MAKAPRAGRIKRRLAASVGVVSAARFYRTCLAHTLLRLGRDPRWRTLLAVSPDSEMRVAAFGVLKLNLTGDGYAWEYLGTNGNVLDSGNATCH